MVVMESELSNKLNTQWIMYKFLRDEFENDYRYNWYTDGCCMNYILEQP